MKVYAGRLNGRALPLTNYLDESTEPVPTAGAESAPKVAIETLRLHGQTFFQAAASGNFHLTLAFLLGGADPEARESEGKGATAMHYAAASGEGAVVQLLFDNGANLNSTTANGQTPLMWAVERGFSDVAKHMVTLGADPTAVDEEGHGIAFHAAFSPLTLHVFVKRGLVDLTKIVDRRHQTPLHHVCQKPNTRIPALYLVESGGVDVNATDNKGKTALHYACATGDIDVVRALVSRGARWDLADGNGYTPLNQPATSRRIRDWVEKFAAETNNTARERMALPDASNWAQLDMDQCKHAAVPFIVPNVLVILGTLLPTILALAVAGVAGGGFAMVAKFGMSQKKRSLATAGWFAGALVFGSGILVRNVFPTYEATHEGTSLPIIWAVATVLMFYCYLRAVFADPGVVHGSPEERRKIYDSIAEYGEAEVQRVGYDTTTMVTKPLRAKHCNKTHYTVYRFDHYCVWTGNAIGGGNHRHFVIYAFFQVVAQLCVLTMTISYLFYAAPSLQKEPVQMGNWCQICNWLFNSENTLVTIFLLMYNSFVFLFVASVCFTQFWYAMRNVTSNEVWFADRYKWMFKLGSRAYSLYDQGALKNFIGFFWRDNLCADIHTVPAMNDHLIKVCRKFSSRAKSQAASQQQFDSHHGHSHGGGGSPGAAAAAGTALGSEAVNFPSTPSASPLVPQDFNLEHAVAQLPEDKQSEMKIVQSLLMQLIAGQDPTPPTSVSVERQNVMLHKARTMFEHYKRATGLAAAAPQIAPAPPAPEPAPAASTLASAQGEAAPTPLSRPAKKGD